MNQGEIYGEETVFGLDIGTRSIIGTIGYKKGEHFEVVAQEIREHRTRAMLDGQIHDINRVAASEIRTGREDRVEAYRSMYSCRRPCVEDSERTY